MRTALSPDGKLVVTRAERSRPPRLWDISAAAEVAGEPRVLGDDPVEEAYVQVPTARLVLTLGAER